MKLKTIFPRQLRTLVPTLLLLLSLTTSLVAANGYLKPHRPDGIALLPPPPTVGSAEQTADLATVQSAYKARTPEEFAQANKSATLSIYNFSTAIGDSFKAGTYPKLDAFFEVVKTNISEAINTPKDHWTRLRPYQVDPTMKVEKPEKSASYPSGHSTRGTVQSLILAELFPEKREAILEYGRSIGWDRVRLAKHFPTDIFGGRVLGKAVFRELMANPAFKRDLDEIKAEIQAAKTK